LWPCCARLTGTSLARRNAPEWNAKVCIASFADTD
jgi:hypothetical protein